jgi:hypothetical protein
VSAAAPGPAQRDFEVFTGPGFLHKIDEAPAGASPIDLSPGDTLLHHDPVLDPNTGQQIGTAVTRVQAIQSLDGDTVIRLDCTVRLANGNVVFSGGDQLSRLATPAPSTRSPAAPAATSAPTMRSPCARTRCTARTGSGSPSTSPSPGTDRHDHEHRVDRTGRPGRHMAAGRRPDTSLLLAVAVAVAVAGLGFQAIHTVEHLLQLGYWLLHPTSHAWLTPWAAAARDALAALTDQHPMTGMELLHLLGNGIFLVGLCATLAAVGRDRAPRALVVVTWLQAAHVAEHLALTATMTLTGDAIGVTTAFGALPPAVRRAPRCASGPTSRSISL